MTTTPEQRARRIDFGRMGRAGLKHSGSAVTEEFMRRLRRKNGRATYKEMSLNDPVIGAMLAALKMLIGQADLLSEPALDDAGLITDEAQAEADFLHEMLTKQLARSWIDVFGDVLTMIEYGFAPFEIVYERRGGRIVVADLLMLSQESVNDWDWDEETERLTWLTQRPDQGQAVRIPIEKVALFRTTSERGNPEGRSMLRNSVTTYVRKLAVEEAEGRAAIRAAGVLVFRIPATFMDVDADPEDKAVRAAYEQLADGLAKDKSGSLLLPSGKDEQGNYEYDVDYLIADGQRPADMSNIVDRYDKRMAMTVLAQFLFLGQNGVGSFSLSSDQTALFSTAVGTLLSRVADTINNEIVAPLWLVNGLSQETRPTIKFSDVEKPNLEAIGRYILSLANAGASLFPNTELENELVGMADLKTRRTDEDMPPAPDGTPDDMTAEDIPTFDEAPEDGDA